ncbi:MAG: hypothetical protein J7J94_01605 [Thaumarchaeota archaeon]|nr:hypothetical protein [Nitrososphaerota archaeon]
MSSDAVEALKEEIWRRAREKADKILRDADEEAKRIVEEAREKVERELKSRIEPERIILRRRLLGKAMMDGRRMVLLAKNEVIEKAFNKALEKLKQLPQTNPSEYEKFLEKVLRKAVEEFSAMGESNLIIYANERDLGVLKKLVDSLSNSSVSFSFEKADLIGGIIVSDRDGRVIFNSSLEGRLNSLRSILRDQVASILFKEVEAS